MNILVIAELLEGQSRNTTLSATAFAAEAAQAAGGSFDILAIGAGAAGAADSLTKYGAKKVISCDVAGDYLGESYAPTAIAVAQQGGYQAIVATASAYGKDLIPRIAAGLNAGMAPDVTSFEYADGFNFTRPMYAGNVIGTLKVTTDTICVTVRQSAFEAATPTDAASPVESFDMVANPLADAIEAVSLEVVKSERPDLAEADVVVAGGRALKSAENFKTVLEPLVDALGAAMGASRAACDAGYVPNDLQVGQTGKMVAPKLYIAVGISGAIQHLAGMKGSKTIVAINTDKEAPIAGVADYFWTADLFEAVPALTEAIKNR